MYVLKDYKEIHVKNQNIQVNYGIKIVYKFKFIVMSL